MNCILFEDDHLLVINKPAGVNTHAPSRFAGEGIYDWLRHREARWSGLAIIHRLDKETSGVLVFGKSPTANQSLTQQFTQRRVHKKYLLVTDAQFPEHEITVRSRISRAGQKYVSSRLKGDEAETVFRPVSLKELKLGLLEASRVGVLEAEPLTGRTHQIRLHASDKGFPILGDTLYGGSAAKRVYLHANSLSLNHPVTGQRLTFRASPQFDSDPCLALREAFIDQTETNSYRLLPGPGDFEEHFYLDKLADFLLAQSANPLTPSQIEHVQNIQAALGSRGVYFRKLNRQVRQTTPDAASPVLMSGEKAPEKFEAQENGIRYELSFEEGYSVGLFLDQRDNRRRVLRGYIAADFPQLWTPDTSKEYEVLNAFAYTCGFSVCAAMAGARVTSIDLSKKYLEWGQRNFALNHLDVAHHEFIYGDVFEWVRRLSKKGRRFDLILLDPPTFSGSKTSGVFRAESHYHKLVSAALGLLKRPGVLFASTNAAGWPPEDFLESIRRAVEAAGRGVVSEHYFPQAPDFPISRAEQAYLKTLWLRLD